MSKVHYTTTQSTSKGTTDHGIEGALGSDILFAGEAGLLDDLETSIASPGYRRDKTPEGIQALIECIYYRDHVLKDADLNKLLNALPDGTKDAKDARRVLTQTNSSLQHKILTQYVLVEARRLVDDFLAREEPADLTTASDKRFKHVLGEQWARNPEQAAKRLWYPLTSTIDFTAQYNPPAKTS
ncbi:hypothetical protein H2201_008240 [Coniosporium apollinis]|uniref:BTB domain-containing protein n=1 Tax=Coniosporium apollinis TaxID=61459 RepID=A0ABQ9NKZ4_9PEZI|nr:hypothetical protein H2201_008240 [Coniosporium apollinis]